MIREDKKMYLEVKDVKKSYGSDAGYTQVLKGVTTSVEKGEMCVYRERAVRANRRSLTA